jgi:twinkle protein
VYADGGAKCFSCGRFWKNYEKGDTVEVKEIVEDIGRFVDIPNRFLSEATCKFYGVRCIVRGGGIAQHIYPYHDSSGEMVAQKVRTVEGKTFHWRGPSTTATLFGQNLFPAKGKFITICEGEIDAMSVWQMSGGKSPVVSVKGGAESALKEIKANYQYLDSFDNIVICFD